MLVPPEGFEGWKVTTVGDDIAWIKQDAGRRRLRAINPEAGFFGVAPGTNAKSNPNAMADDAPRTAIFTNVALTDDGDVWWEGMTDKPPAHLIDWKGKDWTPGCGRPAAHPNARFTAPAEPVPVDRPGLGKSGRRADLRLRLRRPDEQGHAAGLPGLQLEPRRLSRRDDGLGSDRGGDRHQAAMRRDPMAMLPFCGYNMADYFSHWLDVGRRVANPPRIFRVNWFRKDDERQVPLARLRREHARAQWIVDRVHGRGYARREPVRLDAALRGHRLDAASTSRRDKFHELMAVDRDAGAAEAHAHEELFDNFFDRLPKEFIYEREMLRSVCGARPSAGSWRARSEPANQLNQRTAVRIRPAVLFTLRRPGRRRFRRWRR